MAPPPDVTPRSMGATRARRRAPARPSRSMRLSARSLATCRIPRESSGKTAARRHPKGKVEIYFVDSLEATHPRLSLAIHVPALVAMHRGHLLNWSAVFTPPAPLRRRGALFLAGGIQLQGVDRHQPAAGFPDWFFHRSGFTPSPGRTARPMLARCKCHRPMRPAIRQRPRATRKRGQPATTSVRTSPDRSN